MSTLLDTVLYGTFHPPIWVYVLYTLVLTHITIICVTVYYHRAMAHLALTVKPKLAYFFRIWGWLTTGINTKEWVSVHREHHAKDDKQGDPHSPKLFGLCKILFLGWWFYQKASQDKNLLEQRGHGTPDDKLERILFGDYLKGRKSIKRYIGLAIMLVINLILFGLVGLIIWVIQMLWIPFWAAGVINGLGHRPIFRYFLGYRNNDTKDFSSNIAPWGILIGGEELHNNHHAFPGSAKLSLKKYEFDIGWMYICIFQKLGLVRVRHTDGT